ncbi:hypothetical protein [Paraburkholderia caledonica]|uniref:Jacalin-type lectin domain-containing protein n=1 Tax=Paraburkholderia caledonica TaxID=134536 RepID=A0AB73IUJ7_9BURK|nr:hypothetical protein [Paraburkholderia caledonica]
MTRYYDITLTQSGASKPFRQWTSHPRGVFNPAAPDVEFDFQIADYAALTNIYVLTVHGVALSELTQANQFAGMQITIQGGMKSGLPLANPKQAGTLATGTVYQAYGNWEGIDQRLDLVIAPSPYTLADPGNIVLNWKAGQPLSQALQNALAVAYPNVPIAISISDQIVQAHDEPHMSPTLEDLAQFVMGVTKGSFLGANYGGVRITIQNGRIFVWDDTYTPPVVQIAFNDFIGQPTWIADNVMICKFVMRGDLLSGSTIQMPQGLQNLPGAVGTTQQSNPSSHKYQTSFQGGFQVSEIRHIGAYRSPDGGNWCTVVKCLPLNPT